MKQRFLRRTTTIVSSSTRETVECGKNLTASLLPGDGIFLYGDVGAGKTVFVNGIARGLHIPGIVTSPSFTLINEYAGTMMLYHVDLYRVEPADIFFLGLDEYLWGNGITAVEWAERLDEKDHPRVWRVTIEHKTVNKRIITVQCPGQKKRT